MLFTRLVKAVIESDLVRSPRLKRGLQAAWLCLVAVGLVWFVSRTDLVSLFGTLTIELALAATVFVLLAHVGVVLAQSEAISANGGHAGWRTNLRIFNATNLSKYIPLSGANIVVSGALIKKLGLPAAAVGKSLLLVTFWTVLGALCFGVPSVAGAVGVPMAVAVPASILGLIGILGLKPGRRLRLASHERSLPRVFLSQALIWIGYGSAFTLLISRDVSGAAVGAADAVLAGSAYDLSFGVGILAVFAPSGIGVREAITGIAVPSIDYDLVLTTTLLMRAIILGADLLLAAVAYPLTRSSSVSNNHPAGTIET